MNEDLKAGVRIKDNDPRMPNRVLKVYAVGPDWVRAADRSGRAFSIQRRRVHTDDKPRRTGFSLVRDEAE